MQRIIGARQHYPWGSRDGIPAILREPVSDRPLAEYWLGAHPKGPATLHDGATLAAFLSDHPDALGATGRDEYGDVLPFLVKFLSAETALSIQAHPSRAQARAGHAREDASGIPIDAPHRNYRDTWPKPEAVIALTDFDALCGFRDPRVTRALFARLGVAAADDLVAPLTETDGIARVFLEILRDRSHHGDLIDAVADAARVHLASTTDDGDETFTLFCRTAVATHADFPGDPGVLAALLLNRVLLRPGESLALEAGNVHAYLHGTAIEVMSNSDNVLRGGLTGKHIDLDELANVVTFHAETPRVRTWEPTDNGVSKIPTTFDEFAVWKVHDAPLPAVHSPRIVVSLGSARLTSDDAALELRPGHAVFVPADEATTAHGEVIVASHGL